MSDSIKDIATDLNDLNNEMMIGVAVENKIRKKDAANYGERIRMIVKRLQKLGE